MPVDVRHLRAFVAVADEGGFSAAGRSAFLTQQAVSRIVGQLERTVGVALFERTTQGATLTPAGTAMLAPARRALRLVDESVAAARAEGPGAGGASGAGAGAGGPARRVLRVDISSGGIATGAAVVRDLRRRHPEIAVEQVEVGMARGMRLVEEGALDVVLGLATGCPPSLHERVVRREPVLVGMATGHPLAALAEVPVAMLEGVDLLLPSDTAAGEWARFVETTCRQAGVTPQRWPGVTHGSAAAAEVVRDGGCVVPTARWTEEPPGLVFRPLVGPVPLLPWSVVWSPTAADRPEVIAFLTTATTLAHENTWPP